MGYQCELLSVVQAVTLPPICAVCNLKMIFTIHRRGNPELPKPCKYRKIKFMKFNIIRMYIVVYSKLLYLLSMSTICTTI